jgi:hypothetical protein
MLVFKQLFTFLSALFHSLECEINVLGINNHWKRKKTFESLIGYVNRCFTGSSSRPAFNDDVARLQRLPWRRNGRRRRKATDVSGFDGRRRRGAVVRVASAWRRLLRVRRWPKKSKMPWPQQVFSIILFSIYKIEWLRSFTPHPPPPPTDWIGADG